jgi:hypothetical protein
MRALYETRGDPEVPGQGSGAERVLGRVEGYRDSVLGTRVLLFAEHSLTRPSCFATRCSIK